MKAWIANLLWDALAIFLARVHDWIFDPDRAAAWRMKNRQRWWSYKLKADATKSTRDDLRARWYQITFGFETPPDKAVERGDLLKRPANSFRGG